MADDPYALERFVTAQQGTHEQALRELQQGRKRSHWMWFVFPQLAGLGHSATAVHYALSGADEARTYLAHPVLGARLRACTRAVLDSGSADAEAVFGGVDALKFRSSMTVFDAVAPGEVFAEALDRFFHGVRDERSLAILRSSPPPAPRGR